MVDMPGILQIHVYYQVLFALIKTFEQLQEKSTRIFTACSLHKISNVAVFMTADVCTSLANYVALF